MRHIGILGGTFDPVHNGHLGLALEASRQLHLDEVRLIPVNIPPHRDQPRVSANHRLAMLKLAIQSNPALRVDTRELDCDQVSYSINTLKSLRTEYPQAGLYLIMGKDAFNKIDRWRDWQQLLDYVHIVVANRSGEKSDTHPKNMLDWISKNSSDDRHVLTKNKHGFIYFISMPLLDISSTEIRKAMTENKFKPGSLPEKIISYVRENQLYVDTA